MLLITIRARSDYYMGYLYLGKTPSWKGDKWCDDANNNCGCAWDGGDCCGTGNTYKAPYCTECKCKDPSKQ